MTSFNLIRYVVSLVLLVCSFFLYPLASVLVIFVLLMVNNCLDDYVFYQGSRKISRDRYDGGVACPVNGVVTCIESDVHLMHHIRKCDYLEDGMILELQKESGGEGPLYEHMTIFLNKFNCHAVTNIGSPIVREVCYNKDGALISMVEDGDLTTQSNGRFLNNSFIRTEYANGVICVYTLDKYVSKMLPAEEHTVLGVDYFICRGSQCDVYLPKGMKFCVEENEILKNLQTISEGGKTGGVHDYSLEAGKLIDEDPCSHAGHILSSNLKKTLSTYIIKNKPVVATLMIAILIGSIPGGPASHGSLYAVAVIEAFTGLFALDRFFKNLIYAIFNIDGLKPGLVRFYKKIHLRF